MFFSGAITITMTQTTDNEVNNVIIANGEELGNITFDGVTYPASEFSYLPGT